MQAKQLAKLSLFPKASQDWLVACLDPYHDNQIDLEGLPDERTAPSVIQVHNQSVTLTAPASAAGGNWDASVLYTGFDTDIECLNTAGGMVTMPSSAIHPYDDAALSSGQPFGALSYWSGAAGTTWTTGAPTVIGDVNGALGSVFSSERCRLIAVAYEVHNTTAEISKQGSLTVAMLPDTACDHGTVLYVDGGVGAWQPADKQSDFACIRASTLPSLMAVPGSTTWPAAEGVYAIPRMTDVPKRVNLVRGTAPGLCCRIPVIYGTDGLIATPEPAGHLADGVAYKVPYNWVCSPSGFSPIQTYLTGLSPSTTLTVTFRTIVEYFPSLGSPLLPLSSPSPPYDPNIFGLYGETVSIAPYAVPVGQNGMGDYFRKVVRVLSSGLTSVAPFLGEFAPLATMAGKAGLHWTRPKDAPVETQPVFRPKQPVYHAALPESPRRINKREAVPGGGLITRRGRVQFAKKP